MENLTLRRVHLLCRICPSLYKRWPSSSSLTHFRWSLCLWVCTGLRPRQQQQQHHRPHTIHPIREPNHPHHPEEPMDRWSEQQQPPPHQPLAAIPTESIQRCTQNCRLRAAGRGGCTTQSVQEASKKRIEGRHCILYKSGDIHFERHSKNLQARNNCL